MKNKILIVLFVIYIAFIALGLPDALLGSAWTVIHQDFGVQLGAIGIVTVIAYVMTLLSTTLTPWLLRKFDTKLITGVSILFTGSALLVMSQTTSFYQMALLAIPLGAGAGAIDLSLNHYVAIHYKAKHMNYLHSFYGLGVTIGPFIMAYTLRDLSWRSGYLVVGLGLLLIAVLVFISFPYWAKETAEEKAIRHDPVPLKSALQTKGVKHSLAIFLFYVHIESLAGVYIASYYYLAKQVSASEAALFTTMYYAGLFAGRVLGGILSDRVHPNKLIVFGESLMVISAVLMFIPFSQVTLYYIVVFLLGLGSGPVFPNMMHMNPRNFDESKLSKIMSLQMAIGYVGFGALTPLMGLIFQETSITIYPVFILLWGVVLMFITYQFLLFKLHTNKKGSSL